jgi:hypothetical protein
VCWHVSQNEVLVYREKSVAEKEKEEVRLLKVLVWSAGSGRVSMFMVVVVFRIATCGVVY